MRAKNKRGIVTVLFITVIVCLTTTNSFSEPKLTLNERSIESHVKSVIKMWQEYQSKILTRLQESRTPVKIAITENAVRYIHEKLQQEMINSLKQIQLTANVGTYTFRVSHPYFNITPPKKEPFIELAANEIPKALPLLTTGETQDIILETKAGKIRLGDIPGISARFINDLLDTALIILINSLRDIKKVTKIDLETIKKAWVIQEICKPPRKPVWCYLFADP